MTADGICLVGFLASPPSKVTDSKPTRDKNGDGGLMNRKLNLCGEMTTRRWVGLRKQPSGVFLRVVDGMKGTFLPDESSTGRGAPLESRDGGAVLGGRELVRA